MKKQFIEMLDSFLSIKLIVTNWSNKVTLVLQTMIKNWRLCIMKKIKKKLKNIIYLKYIVSVLSLFK